MGKSKDISISIYDPTSVDNLRMTCFSEDNDDELSDTEMPVHQGKGYSLQCALISHTEWGPLTNDYLIQLATDL